MPPMRNRKQAIIAAHNLHSDNAKENLSEQKETPAPLIYYAPENCFAIAGLFSICSG